MPPLTAPEFRSELLALATEEQRVKYQRFFPGDDSFVGVRMGDVFALAKSALEMPVAEIERLLEDEVHEVRAGACSVMGKAATHKKVEPERHGELYALLRRRHDRIDTWDLVDLVAAQVVGSWLRDRPRDPLYELADSEFWPERRTAIVSTAALIKRGDTGDAFAISEFLLRDDEVFVQKGAGWMLRYAGDSSPEALRTFLDEHAPAMPRVMLRMAIEKLPKETRAAYLAA